MHFTRNEEEAKDVFDFLRSNEMISNALEIGENTDLIFYLKYDKNKVPYIEIRNLEHLDLIAERNKESGR